MIKEFSVIILVTLIGLINSNATGYYVSPSGSNNNPGTILLPFQTINYALSKASKPGDTVYLRAGTYREVATFPFSGTAAAPIVLTAYNGEQAIISGTDVYDTLSWMSTNDVVPIYQASYTGTNFEQLFYKGKPMVQARWPNLETDSVGNWNFWDSSRWADAGNGSAYGTIVDASPNSLASSGLNAQGALAVLNVGPQYYCYSRIVSSHTPGTSTFTYPKDFTSIDLAQPFNDDRYYLVGKLEFLDAPGEWFNDTANHLLYFYPPDGQNPSLSGGIEIKTRNFALQATSKHYLVVQNITFWGTAFQFNAFNEGCNNLVLKNNTILNSSWTEYYKVLSGQPGYNDENNFPTIYGNNCQVIGNTFANGALSSLLIAGKSNLVENNNFHDFDYNTSLATPLLQISKTFDSYIGKAGKATVRYNDIYSSGGVLLQIGQDSNNVCYNHFHDAFLSCFGGNKDVSMIYTNCQTNTSSTMGTRIYNNWLHNGYAGTVPTYWACGEGIRGDDTTAGLTVDHNVTWNLGSVGVEIKSPSFPTPAQANRALNNTSFNNSKLISPPLLSSVILESQVDSANLYSSIYNNVGKGTYGGWKGAAFQFLKQIGNNYDKTTALPLVDTASYDFRPSAGSALVNKGMSITRITNDVTDGMPDLGAYERGEATYWIPGFRSNKTSFPIVFNGATNVSITRDQLMWKPAYNAVSNRIYFGTSLVDLILQSNTSEEQNVFILPKITTGTTYYWRVDAVMADSSVVTGDVWSFTTAGSLPVKLIDFSGVVFNKTNELKWETTNEINLKGFSIQRLNQLNSWDELGFVVSKGKGASYKFVDESPFVTTDYRLVMKDADGLENFSKVVSVTNQSNPKVKISSDATLGKVHISFNAILTKAAIITIYDLTGRVLLSTKTSNISNLTDISSFSKGIYIVYVRYDNCNYFQKIIF